METPMAKQPDRDWREQVIRSLPTMEANPGPGATGLQPGPVDMAPAPTPMSLGPALKPFDVIELLPPAAQDRLRMLRQRAADAHALIPEFETIREASMARIEAENALKRLTSHPQDGGFNLPATDSRVVAAEKHLEKMTADFRRLQELQEVRSAAWRAASGALAAVEDWLRHGKPANCVLEAIETEPPKLAKNEPGLLDAIENRRRRVRELRADLHRIASAPFPSSYAKQRMREQIDALAMNGAPSVSALVELDGRIEFQTQRVTSEVHAAQRALAFTEIEAAIPTLAWLFSKELISKLDAEISAESDDGAALSHEARQQREAEVMGDMLAVERDECALVWQAQAQNLLCEHRADVSVAALLSITLVTTPRADASPETSLGYSWPMRG
jgi:hypothetical protein